MTDLPLPVLLVHPFNGTIRGFNGQARHLTGYLQKDLRDVSCTSLFPDTYPENARAMKKIRLQNRSAAVPVLRSVLVPASGIPRRVHLIPDFTPHRRRNSRLVRILILDVQETGEKCREKTERYRKACLRMNLAIGSTRHDIANCLYTIRGYSALLEPLLNGKATDRSLELLDKIQQQNDKISRILALSRLYEKPDDCNQVWMDVGSMIREALCGDLRIESEIAGLEVFADPVLKMVFYTIVENSLRHGGPVTTIRIDCRCDDLGCVIGIEDDGVGIADDRKERIFDMGYGNHSGYGLYFARRIVGLNDMQIRETGTCGSGARFEILVPGDRYRFNDRTKLTP